METDKPIRNLVACMAAVATLTAAHVAEAGCDADADGQEEPALVGNYPNRFAKDGAKTKPSAWPCGQRYFGIGAYILKFWGFGGGIRAGHPYVGVDLSGGWQPILIAISDPMGSSGGVEGFSSAQANAQLYVAFNPRSKFSAGLVGGYTYNTLLGHGGMLGFDGMYNAGDQLGVRFAAGIMVNPEGDELLLAEAGLPKNTKLEFPSASVQPGLGFGLVFFP